MRPVCVYRMKRRPDGLWVSWMNSARSWWNCAKRPTRTQCLLGGAIARRMHAAVAPFAAEHFVTPMAAVAGAVAEEILGAMLNAAQLDRAYVNNGGDIALHLDVGKQFTVGLVDRPDQHGAVRTLVVGADDATRGIATSGRHGRSFSLGIADAVTVLARSASQADAAATIIANAVDLPGHPAVIRCPANQLQPDSDLGARLVTRDVGELSNDEIERALDAGAACSRELLAKGLIEGALLRLFGQAVVVGTRMICNSGYRPLDERTTETMMST